MPMIISFLSHEQLYFLEVVLCPIREQVGFHLRGLGFDPGTSTSITPSPLLPTDLPITPQKKRNYISSFILYLHGYENDCHYFMFRPWDLCFHDWLVLILHCLMKGLVIEKQQQIDSVHEQPLNYSENFFFQ